MCAPSAVSASTNLKTNHGDSGGPVISGTAAVGITSAGDETGTVFAVDLKDALAPTDGYTVKIFLEAPRSPPRLRFTARAPSPAPLRGARFRHHRVRHDRWQRPPMLPWGQTARGPSAPRTSSAPSPVTAQAKNGFSTSATTTASIKVIKETLAAPAITTPADGSSVGAPVTTITGTGKPGATVELSGDVTGTAVVGADGKWSFTLPRGLDDR